MNRTLVLLAALACLGAPATAQQVQVEEYILDNGMTFLLVSRDEEPNIITACWVAKVGSVNERPGITGISHFFEHMMFKGTSTIGTTDAARERELVARQDALKHRLDAMVWSVQFERWRRGEIDDPLDPVNDTPEMAALRSQLKEATDEHAQIIVKDEFDSVYTKLGASGVNAFTA